MKKRLLFLVTFVASTSISALAQSPYHPMLSNNPEWYGRLLAMFPLVQIKYRYAIEKDTTINSKIYQKITSKSLTSGYPYSYTYIVREDSTLRRVYIWDGSNDQTLYNFAHSLGSQINLQGTLFSVTDVDSISTNEGFRKQIRYQSGTNYFYVVEGVGSMEEPFYIHEMSSDPAYTLDCNFKNGKIVYSSPSNPNENCSQASTHSLVRREAKMYPNPASHNIYFNTMSDEKINAITVIDIRGKVVLEGSNISSTEYNFSNIALPPALYNVLIKTSKTVYTQKLTIR